MKGKKARKIGIRGESGLTIKQEKFAAAYIETGNASEAYRRAYDTSRMKTETVNRKAFDVLNDGKVTARITWLREGAAKRSRESVDDILTELEDARKLAMTSTKSVSAAVSASHVKAKMLGYISQKVDANVNVNNTAPNPLTAFLDTKIAQGKEKPSAKGNPGDSDDREDP